MNNERLEEACNRSPIIRQFIRSERRWQPGYQLLLNRIERACQKHQACGHGETHQFLVVNNAFTMKDFTQKQLGITMSDEAVVIAVFGHDAGYGLSGVHWYGPDAIDHASYGRKFLQWLWSHSSEPENLLSEEGIIFSAMDGTTSERLADARELLNTSQYDVQVILPILVKLADGFDYFRRQRLDGIAAPEHYEENPYYFLAQAVLSYCLETDHQQGILRYIPRIDRRVSFEWWYDQTKHHYGAVWDLAQTFAEITGSRFEIQPEREG